MQQCRVNTQNEPPEKYQRSIGNIARSLPHNTTQHTSVLVVRVLRRVCVRHIVVVVGVLVLVVVVMSQRRRRVVALAIAALGGERRGRRRVHRVGERRRSRV